MSDTTASEAARIVIAARHGDETARSVLELIDGLGLVVRVKPNLVRRAQRERERERSDEAHRARRRAHRRQSTTASQNATAVRAGRRGQPWTGPELELAARRDLTAEQVATMTGRTYYAIENMRRKLEVDPRRINLAGVAGQHEAPGVAGLQHPEGEGGQPGTP